VPAGADGVGPVEPLRRGGAGQGEAAHVVGDVLAAGEGGEEFDEGVGRAPTL
jgi:hypothetical protein